MKKILFSVLLVIISITLIGCTPAVVEEVIVDVDVRITNDATSNLYVGDQIPDFSNWFELTVDGNIQDITSNMISHDLIVSDGIISETGEYSVLFTFIAEDDVAYSEVVTIVVEEHEIVAIWDVEHYMMTNLRMIKSGATVMAVSKDIENDYSVLNVDVKQAKDTDWHALLGFEGLDFKSGHTYTYRITIKTDVPGGRNVGISFESADHSRLSYSVLELTNEYQTFTSNMISPSDLSDGKLNLFLGDITTEEIGLITIKEIQVIESFEVIDGLENPGELSWTAPDLTTMDSFVDNLLASMTIEEKIGQMIQAERSSVSPGDIKQYNLGSVLNGGGSIPGDDIEEWYRMYLLFQIGASESSSGIPIIFGTDSVHGNNNLLDATLFPHNIGLGAANDPELMRRIGEVVAIETRLSGISWTFAPAVSIAQDARWGRTYESFSESTSLVSGLTAPYIEGLQDFGVSATAKHFLGDGGTVGGSDQGNVVLSEQEIRDLHLAPYYEAIAADVDTIMISYSSINGAKMHGSTYWIQTVLKDEMGFEGFIISDYDAIHQLGGSHYNNIVDSVNAGIDMLMEPHDWKVAYEDILSGYNNGDISLSRIDDAVRRILIVKYKRGLFSEDIFRYQPELLATAEHLAIAREAVRKSLVLLQNDNDVLPLSKTEKIVIIGPGADDIGLVLGGWSLGWQGLVDPNNSSTTGFGQRRLDARVTTILEGFENALIGETGMIVTDISEADTVIVVLAEKPYAEYYGDDSSLDIIEGNNAHYGNEAAIAIAQQAKADGKKVIGILLSGRPLLIQDILPYFDAFVAAWLPGSEAGNGIADVLLGDYNFTGTTPFVWYKDSSMFGTNSNTEGYNPDDYLFPFGYGLDYTEQTE